MMPRLTSHRPLLARIDNARLGLQPESAQAYALLALAVDRPHEAHCGLGGDVQRALLAQVVRRLREAVGHRRLLTTDAAIGKLSDSSIVVLIPGVTDERELGETASRIQELLAAPYEVEGHRVYLTSCCGIARVTKSHANAADALGDALAALAVSKSRGEGSRVVFDETLRANLRSAFEIGNALRSALDTGELVLYFQPIVSLDSSKLWGLETLLRWRQPDGSFLSPSSFIDVAERSDLIVHVDRWVIGAACRQLKSWLTRRDMGEEITVSVNVSGVHFGRPDLLATIDRSLRAAGIYGRSLALEITESAIMENAPFTRDMLQQLRSLGIRVSIDDFGTGYSSLANLRRFDVDTLKIDCSFVSRVDTDEESREIVRTVISLASSLGKRVIAEGIETASQATALRSLGCRLGQGYYFSLPMDADATTRYLQSMNVDDLFTA